MAVSTWLRLRDNQPAFFKRNLSSIAKNAVDSKDIKNIQELQNTISQGKSVDLYGLSRNLRQEAKVLLAADILQEVDDDRDGGVGVTYLIKGENAFILEKIQES